MSMQPITGEVAANRWLRRTRLFLITKSCFQVKMLFFVSLDQSSLEKVEQDPTIDVMPSNVK